MKYLVLRLSESIITESGKVTFKNDEGIVGVFPIFDSIKLAEDFAEDKYDIMTLYEESEQTIVE